MPFRLAPDDPSLTAALHRIAASELGGALARLQAKGQVPPEGVHDVRKRIKKLRGLLRMLRPGLPAYDRENAELREAAQALSAMRDGAVRLATFDALVPDPTGGFATLREALADEARTTAAAADAIAQSRDRLAQVLNRVPDWHLTARDAKVLAKGLTRTRARARDAMEAARHDPDLEAIHTWRKRAKDYWYQARLFSPVWPEAIEPLAETASDLTEELGRHHDLGVLADHLAAHHAHSADPESLHDLTRRAAAEQRKIEAQAFIDGHRLFAGDPQAMADVWVEWWRLWKAR